jgi:hypothetical protein
MDITKHAARRLAGARLLLASSAILRYAYLGEAVRSATEENIALVRLGASLNASVFLPMAAAGW